MDIASYCLANYDDVVANSLGVKVNVHKSASFWNRIAKFYAKQPVADEASYQKKLAMTQAYFQSEMEVLELGCGTGSTAVIHAPFVKRIVAVDYSEKMLAIARDKARGANIHNIDFQQASIEDIALAEASQDAVMAMSLLHLLNDQKAALDKIYHSLKPGGLFFSSTICLADTQGLFKYIAPVGFALRLIPKIGFFSAVELCHAIERTGFDIVEQWQPGPNKAIFIVAKKPLAKPNSSD